VLFVTGLNPIVLLELFKHSTVLVSLCIYPKSSSRLNYLIIFLLFLAPHIESRDLRHRGCLYFN